MKTVVAFVLTITHYLTCRAKCNLNLLNRLIPTSLGLKLFFNLAGMLFVDLPASFGSIGVDSTAGCESEWSNVIFRQAETKLVHRIRADGVEFRERQLPVRYMLIQSIEITDTFHFDKFRSFCLGAFIDKFLPILFVCFKFLFICLFFFFSSFFSAIVSLVRRDSAIPNLNFTVERTYSLIFEPVL